MFEPLSSKVEYFAGRIVDSAFKVHSTLGPGMMESVYETCLCHELRKQNLALQRQVYLPVVYDNIRLEQSYRLDLIVEDCIICELKAVELIAPTHHAQLLSYLRLTGKRLGLLINFNVPRIKDGIKRIIL